MASEDSDQVRTGLPAIMVWAISPISSSPSRVWCRPSSIMYMQRANFSKSKRLADRSGILLEEGNDLLEQLVAALHNVLRHVLTVIVVARVRVDEAGAAEEVPKVFKAVPAAHALRHNEPVGDLIAELVGASAPSASLADEPDREASFSVYKPEDPS
jgi:hypothetical protein